MKIALFPGSFDPITKGHQDIIERATPLFDTIIVAIGSNSSKKYLYTLEERLQWIEETFSQNKKIEVATYTGLTIDYCKKVNANYILRGLRNTVDYNYEANIAKMNKAMQRNIETIFMLTSPNLSAINSNIVRDIINNNGDASQFIPEAIQHNFKK